MFITLHGKDSYRKLEKRKELIQTFRKKYPLGEVRFFSIESGEEKESFFSFTRANSLFTPSKLIFLEDVFSDTTKGYIKRLQEVESYPGVTCAISSDNAPLKAFGFLLKKPNLIQEFEALKGKEWELFVAGELKKMNLAVFSGLAQISKMYEGDSWGFATELRKIACVIDVKKEWAKEYVHVPALDFWATTNGLRYGFPGERLAVLERSLGGGEAAAKLFHVLAYQVPEKIRQMADYDRMVKSGKLDYEEALVDLLIN